MVQTFLYSFYIVKAIIWTFKHGNFSSKLIHLVRYLFILMCVGSTYCDATSGIPGISVKTVELLRQKEYKVTEDIKIFKSLISLKMRLQWYPCFSHTIVFNALHQLYITKYEGAFFFFDIGKLP